MMMRSLAILLLLTGCAGPGKSRFARAAYLACPQTVSVGAIVPGDGFGNTARTLFTLSATYQLRPFIPPVAQPSLR